MLRFFPFALCLLSASAAQAAGVSFGGLLPTAVLHNVESRVGLEPVETMDVRESLRDASNFAELLILPAFESDQRRDELCEINRHSGYSFHELRLRPRFEIQDTNEGFVILGALPGLRREDLSLEILEHQEGHIVAILGGSPLNHFHSSSPSREEVPKHMPRIRAGYAKFERRFRLPQHTDASTLRAKYENGLLVVTLAKKESVIRHKVTFD